MALPLDVPGDFAAVYGDEVRSVSYRQFDPATDAHATGVTVSGVRDGLSHETRSVEGGEERVTVTTWWLAMDSRPRHRSLIVDGSDTWVIDPERPVNTEPVAGVYPVGATLA